LFAVGQAFEDFSGVTDEMVVAALAGTTRPSPMPST
jgi:predicted phosphoribosyltransferase